MKTNTLFVNGSVSHGPFPQVNGLNGGPKYGNSKIDLRDLFRAIAPPSVRLHDVSLLSAFDAVDIHSIFPLPHADPDDPANYRFAKTDAYLQQIRDIDAEIVFRLGESIEHASPKHHVHPPADPARWARVCANIVRHYNHGWADGHEWGIRYWEIWNEANIEPCWTGTMEDYCELYRHTALAIKAVDPEIKVGGPALAGTLDSKAGRLFLAFVREHELPLDFASWHEYGATPRPVLEAVRSGIAALREFGFEETETHFNEWNLFAGDFSRAMNEANYYCAFPKCSLSMLGEYTLPGKNYHAFAAFRRLVELGERIESSGEDESTGLAICAAASPSAGTAGILLANFADAAERVRVELQGLPLGERSRIETFLLDETHDLTLESVQIVDGSLQTLELSLPAPSVRLIMMGLPQQR